MMTAWPGGIGQANGARGAYRSRLRNEFSEVGTEELFGPFGAKERSARVTERSVRALRVREGVGGNSRALGRRVAVIGAQGSGRNGAGRRGAAERPSDPRRGDFGEINPSLGSRIPIFGKLELFGPNLEKYS